MSGGHGAAVGAAGAGWLALLALAAAPPAAGNSDGPPAGFTGGFGEPTCRACHFDAPEEPGEGELVLVGIPKRYEPGVEYRVTVTLREPRLERAGFQLAVRFAGEGAEDVDPARGARLQAGRLLPAEPRTGPRVQVVEHGDPPVLYARQTLAGAEPVAAQEAFWSVRWIAPEERAEPVLFHAAANAANHDDSALGDLVHTASAGSEPRR